jgi:DNA-binding LacI/PurR family transcriptional regulator
MTLLPKRTITSQITEHLRSNIEAGMWHDWLPTERQLCSLLQASRNTIRAAIKQLKAERLVVSEKPTGNRIVANAARLRMTRKNKSIGIIIPEPLNNLRPMVSLWIDELKDLLLEEGCSMRIYDGQGYYRANAARALERLVKQSGHDAWVLVLSSQSMQQWFARHQIRCLVAGSTYPEIQLPFCDLDYRAVCRHAAGVLIRAGHTRITLLNHEFPRAGEIAGERGFYDAIDSTADLHSKCNIVYHRDTVDSIAVALKKLGLGKAGFPTALIVNSPYAYLTVMTLLASKHLRVPEDVSLISRDDDALLNSIYPAPARYTVKPQAFARRFIGPIMRMIQGRFVATGGAYILPKFVSGKSVAAPRSAG